MTLPDERYRAVINTRDFLLKILSTPRVPKEIKEGARHCLRHYPVEWEMQMAAKGAPTVFAENMEPLYRMVKQYEKNKDKDDNNKNSTG